MMAKEKPPITVVGDVGGRIAIIVVGHRLPSCADLLVSIVGWVSGDDRTFKQICLALNPLGQVAETFKPDEQGSLLQLTHVKWA